MARKKSRDTGCRPPTLLHPVHPRFDPTDRSYGRKFNDLQRRLSDLYGRDVGLSGALDEAQAKMTTAEKRTGEDAHAH